MSVVKLHSRPAGLIWLWTDKNTAISLRGGSAGLDIEIQIRRSAPPRKFNQPYLNRTYPLESRLFLDWHCHLMVLYVHSCYIICIVLSCNSYTCRKRYKNAV